MIKAEPERFLQKNYCYWRSKTKFRQAPNYKGFYYFCAPFEEFEIIPI